MSTPSSLQLIGIEGSTRKFWAYERVEDRVTIRQGAQGAEGKLTTKAFASEDAAAAFVAKQVAAQVNQGYHVDLPFEIRTWADVRAEVSAVLAGNSEANDDRVLVLTGDVVIPHNLWLDYRCGILALTDDHDSPFSGLIVRGSLTVEGCLHNNEDDYGPFLLVEGNLTARSVATGGARVYVRGDAAADVVVGVYNHGCVEIGGALTTPVIGSEHTVTAGRLDAIFFHGWGQNAFPSRAGVVDATDPYEPRGLFVSALVSGEQVDLKKARKLAIAGKPVLRAELTSVRAAFRKLVAKKLAEPDKVKSLALRSKDLSTLPEELFVFRKLEKLELTHNNLRLLPEQLGHLTELRELHLRGNGLQTLPESVGALTKLRVLNLEANCIWRLPDSLAQCTELRVVNLTNNPYSYVRSSFGGWDKVQLMWDFPEVLTRLPKLEQVTFSGTFLSTLPSRRFDSPRARVTIENSLVTEVPPELADQVSVDLKSTRERPVNYIRYWFDSDDIHLDDFYSAATDRYDFTQVCALLALVLKFNLIVGPPYDAAIATFEKQAELLARHLNWDGEDTRHVQALFRALLASIDRLGPSDRDAPLLEGVRRIFATHAA
ncbi:MAG: leucine-rich repeat domain-containing protein [Kofleriaceae bacterium]